MTEFGVRRLTWQLVMRDLSYRAPNRGAVCGILLFDTGLRIFGGLVLCVEALFVLCFSECDCGRLPHSSSSRDDNKMRPGF